MSGAPPATALHVEDVSYSFLPGKLESYANSMLSIFGKARNKFLGSGRKKSDQFLPKVSFKAEPGKITGIIGDHNTSRKTLMDLICGHRRYGSFTGDIYMSNQVDVSALDADIGLYKDKKFAFFNMIGFVPRKSLHLPGLTYLDMVEYSAQLKLICSSITARDRAMDALELVGLSDKAHYTIPEEYSTRGDVGSDLRRLTIAIGILSNAPIIVMDDPLKNVDSWNSTHTLEVMRRLADRGHTVIATFSSPEQHVLECLDTVVLLSGGRSVFSGPRNHLHDHFSASTLGYNILQNNKRTMVDFLLDLSSGIELAGSGLTLGAEQLQALFENSKYKVAQAPKTNKYMAYSETGSINRWMFTDCVGIYAYLFRLFVVFRRTLSVKFRERQVLMKSLLINIFLPVLIGSMMYGQGDFGDAINQEACIEFTIPSSTNPPGIPVGPYCLFPSFKVMNISGSMFLSISLAIAQQVLNVQLVVRKLLVYKYEQRSGYCPPVIFGLILMFCEMIPAFIFGAIYSSIYLKLTMVSTSGSDYIYFTQVLWMAATMGITTTLFLASLFVRELIVRDIYLLLTLFMLLLSSFVFNIDQRTPEVQRVMGLNPMRWLFEALMIWKYQDYPDAYNDKQLVIPGSLGPPPVPAIYLPIPGYLDSYGYSKGSYSRTEVFEYLRYFYYFSISLMLINMLPAWRRLFRSKESRNALKDSATNSHRESVDQSLKAVSTKISGAGVATSEMEEAAKNVRRDSVKGPVIEFRNISYSIDSSSSFFGRTTNNILNNISGKFGPGELHAILGPASSGRSSLLWALAGEISPHNAKLSGKLLVDGVEWIYRKQGWERCGLVESMNSFHRDLSVRQCLTYSTRIRRDRHTPMAEIQKTVENVMVLASLKEKSEAKTKDLNAGELRLLAIAEELVNGKTLLFVDEPTTNLNSAQTALVMKVLEMLVSLNYTVVCSFHEPSTELFKSLDNIMLMSQGRVVYHGKANNAVNHFVSAPYHFSNEKITAPWGFLASITSNTFLNRDKAPLHKLVADNPDKVYQHGFALSGDTANPLLGGKSEATSDESDRFSHTASEVASSRPPLFSVERATLYFWRASVLTERSFMSLWQRKKLLYGAPIFYFMVAILMGCVIYSVKGIKNDTTAYFALSNVMLIFLNILYIFYLSKCNEIFLKEHARGLYSYTVVWALQSLPVYILQIFASLVYGVVIYYWIELNPHDNAPIFYLVTIATLSILGTVLCETVLYLSPSIRQSYISFPVVIFLLFYFSSLPIKPPTYAVWMRNWVPDLSFFRWALEAELKNEFQGSRLTSTFQDLYIYLYGNPQAPSTYIGSLPPPSTGFVYPLYSFYSYDFYLSIMGFDNDKQSTTFCYGILFFNLLVFRVISLLALRYSCHRLRGTRHFYQSAKELE